MSDACRWRAEDGIGSGAWGKEQSSRDDARGASSPPTASVVPALRPLCSTPRSRAVRTCWHEIRAVIRNAAEAPTALHRPPLPASLDSDAAIPCPHRTTPAQDASTDNRGPRPRNVSPQSSAFPPRRIRGLRLRLLPSGLGGRGFIALLRSVQALPAIVCQPGAQILPLAFPPRPTAQSALALLRAQAP